MNIAGAIVQLILLIVGALLESNKEQKAKKQAIAKELGDAIKARDTSAITAALSGLR